MTILTRRMRLTKVLPIKLVELFKDEDKVLQMLVAEPPMSQLETQEGDGIPGFLASYFEAILELVRRTDIWSVYDIADKSEVENLAYFQQVRQIYADKNGIVPEDFPYWLHRITKWAVKIFRTTQVLD